MYAIRSYYETKQKLIPNVFFGVNSMVLSVLLGITLHAIHIENQYKNHYSHYQDHNLHLITGSIGFIGIDGTVCLNIAIRTIIIAGKKAFRITSYNVCYTKLVRPSY